MNVTGHCDSFSQPSEETKPADTFTLWLPGAPVRAFCEGSCLAPVKLEGEEVPHSGPQSPAALPSGVYSVIWDSPELSHHGFFFFPFFWISSSMVYF